ncbi:MAG: hypothetical protein JRG89_24390 [Deltaproteobacteria bacterium]|nr:hypothetical protein [Deltaproteobacteria bacterium]
MSHSGVILVVQTQALSRRGDHAGACDEARRLVEACRSGQNTAALAIGYAALGMASLRAGQPDEAARALSEAVKISVDRGLSLGIAPVHLASLAEAEIECGDLAAAYHAIERGRKLAAEQEALLMLGVIDLQHARLILAEADTAASDRAREKLDAIESLAHERGNQGLLAGVGRGLEGTRGTRRVRNQRGGAHTRTARSDSTSPSLRRSLAGRSARSATPAPRIGRLHYRGQHRQVGGHARATWAQRFSQDHQEA